MRIERWDPRRDGPYSEIALQQKIAARNFQFQPRSLPSGAVMAGQPADCDRLAAVVSGLIKITLEDESAILRDGDIVSIPPDRSPRFEVLGTTAALYLEAVQRTLSS